MKKRLLCFLLTLLLGLSGTAPVYGDVLIEPQDAFYRSHQGEFDYLYRRYAANGQEGYGTIWKSPNSSAQNENVPNGEVLSCHHHYTDANGDIWGGAWSGDSEKLRGWINISRDFAPVADYLSFQEAHGDEFVGYDKSYDDAFAGLETAVLWTYPGSGKISQEVDARWFQENMDVSDFQEYYLDEAGRCWGFVGYCYGIRNTWVCLSDPANSGLDRIEGIIPGAVSLKGLLIMAEEVYPPSEAVPAPKSGIGLTTILLVAAVVLGTALLIPRVCGKK